MGSLSTKAMLVPRGQAAAVILDDDQVASVGEGAKRFPVVATVNGYTWRTSVVRMGGEFMLGLNREVREGANVEAGDAVDLQLELDTEPREVEVPPVLAAALAADPKLRAAWDKQSYTHRKEHARWIVDAKLQETRERRLAKLLEHLRGG